MDKMTGDDELLVDIDLDLPTNVAAASGWLSSEPVEPKPKVTQELEPKEPAVSPELETARRQAQEAQARLDALSKQADEERQGRLKAQEDAQRNQTYALNAHLARMDANLARVNSDHDQLTSSISAWKNHIDMAKRQLTSARDAGDGKTETDLMDQIAEARAMLTQLEAGRTGALNAVEDAKRERERAVLAAQQAAQRAQEDAERASQKETEPKQITPDEYIDNVRARIGSYGADWFKEHKEFITDRVLHKKMQSFVEDWVDRNGESAMRTQSFKTALDERFGFKKAEPTPAPEEENEEMEDEKPQRQPSAPAAPVSRQSNSMSKPNGNGAGSRMRLSPEEQATAVLMYPDMVPADARKKYATNKARLIADGRL